MGIYGEDLEEIIAQLIEDKFLDEERFTRSYVRGKFRMNKWGKIRIKQELKKRKISDYCVRKGMEEITEEEYIEQIRAVLLKKAATLNEDNDYKRRNKLAAHAFRRGYETELVWSIINKME